METTLLDKLDEALYLLLNDNYEPEFIQLSTLTYVHLKKLAYNKFGYALDFKYYNNIEFKIDDTIDAGVFYITFKF